MSEALFNAKTTKFSLSFKLKEQEKTDYMLIKSCRIFALSSAMQYLDNFGVIKMET